MGRGRRADLERALGHRFERPSLLDRALTHASLAGEGARGGGVSNERMEFLGDRVLGLVVAEVLFHRFPDEVEGALARRLAMLVRRESLARVAAAIGLADHVAMAKGEIETGGRGNPSVLADACEAVIAALYLDGGLEAAARFVCEQWAPLVEEAATPPQDAKTALQEWAQGRGLPLPSYSELGRSGPAHAPEFAIEAAIAGYPPATATGPNKRLAEQAAAQTLLERVRGEHG